MSDKDKTKLHFELLEPGGKLQWHKQDNYAYTLESTPGSLQLNATVTPKSLPVQMGVASPIDHFVWDELVHGKKFNRCDALTLWTSHVEFDLLLYGNNDNLEKLQCSYFCTPDVDAFSTHLAYLALFEQHDITETRPTVLTDSAFVLLKRAVHQLSESMSDLNSAFNNGMTLKELLDAQTWLRNQPHVAAVLEADNVHLLNQEPFLSLPQASKHKKVLANQTIVRALLQSDLAPLHHKLIDVLPQMLIWNRYTKCCSHAQASNGRKQSFQRQHAYALDHFRSRLQTIPIPNSFLEPAGKPITLSSDPESAANDLYRAVLERYAQVAGCCSPMQRNLLALASLVTDPDISVALVTGEPGTGKENLSKAIYYGTKLRQPPRGEAEAVFLQTTAGEIEAEVRAGTARMPGQFLKERIAQKMGWFGTMRAKGPVVFIDELNKASPEFLAGMLRPLEQGGSELNTDGKPKFILAASQHIEELAKKPPQDFWTRVSHQLRVIHPLSRVSEEDAERFLRSFYFSEWWNFVARLVANEREDGQDIVEAFIGKLNHGVLEESPLCSWVRDEFLNALVPLVSRDTLSVRGVRSMVSQMSARVSWYVRFQKPLGKGQLDAQMANEVARLVNTAVQDVMAILNPARATPAGMDDPKRR